MYNPEDADSWRKERFLDRESLEFTGTLFDISGYSNSRRQYNDYLSSDQWRFTRKKALSRSEHKCEYCGSTERLQVHHLSYKHIGRERPEDLIVLCGSCHTKIHEISV